MFSRRWFFLFVSIALHCLLALSLSISRIQPVAQKTQVRLQSFSVQDQGLPAKNLPAVASAVSPVKKTAVQKSAPMISKQNQGLHEQTDVEQESVLETSSEELTQSVDIKDEFMNKRLSEESDYAQVLSEDLSAEEQSNESLLQEGNIIAPFRQISFPHSAKLRYEAPYGLTATMNFERKNGRYTITAKINIPFRPIEFISEGRIERNQLIPDYYRDIRKGKVYASAQFDYEAQSVHYGKGERPDKTAPILGAQYDFFAWAWQMSISGGYWGDTIYLTNGKKIYEQISPSFEDMLFTETLWDTDEGLLRIVQQEIDRSGDQYQDSISYGFAPDFANIPALIVLNDGNKTYRLHIIGIELDGKNYWHALRSVNRNRSSKK